MNTQNVVIGVLVALTLLFGSLWLFQSDDPNLGKNSTGPAHEQIETFKQGIQIGQNGTIKDKELFGTCTIAMHASTFPASSTMMAVCAATGVVSGDNVQVWLPVGAGANLNGSGSPGGGFRVITAVATSSNKIQVVLANDTGASTTTPAHALVGAKWMAVSP